MPVPSVLGALNRGYVLRAVLENIAFALRANLEQIESITGKPVVSLSLCGGLTRTKAFSQIVADVLNRPIKAALPDASAQGAAMAGATAAGLYRSLGEAVGVLGQPQHCLEPTRLTGLYTERYREWCAIESLMSRASEV